jgi:hypothetical protein
MTEVTGGSQFNHQDLQETDDCENLPRDKTTMESFVAELIKLLV